MGLKPPKYEGVETLQPLDILEKVRIARQLWPGKVFLGHWNRNRNRIEIETLKYNRMI